MNFLFFAFLLISIFARAQDTIKVIASRPQVIQALLEKGYAIAIKEDSKIVTKALTRQSISSENRNQFLTRLTFVWQDDTCKISGEYSKRFSYIHEGDKSWIPITNDKTHRLTWSIVNEFVLYLKK